MANLIRIKSLRELPENWKTLGVIGYPGAGKTTICLRLLDHMKIIHTDGFLNFSHDDRPAAIMTHVSLKGPEYVIEGNEVTRLIKRGWKPDALLLVEGSTRNDKATNGLRGRVDKFLNGFYDTVYVINPRVK